MEYQFEALEKTRKTILRILDGLTMDQLNIIPEGFNNNIAWNFAHLVVTQQLICYYFSGLPLEINKDLVNKYRKGSTPSESQPMSREEWEYFKNLFLSNVQTTKEDYQKGKFENYKSYTTSLELTINTIEDAINFNNVHEGLHLGYILALKRVI
ncbi:DinB family protein [Membranihabitans maritimus]|uniref:DinB family protein n=1 Tax=Membranihabitans maritimus TaxID=2904244 RepID=UPI001F3CE70B|nr:DinB family protein [Membranihabitans maritimus]